MGILFLLAGGCAGEAAGGLSGVIFWGLFRLWDSDSAVVLWAVAVPRRLLPCHVVQVLACQGCSLHPSPSFGAGTGLGEQSLAV